MVRVFRVVLSLSVALSADLALAVGSTDLPTFRGAQIVKSKPVENSAIEVPLAKIYRSGRGWEPEKVERIEGTAFQTLYKIGRNVELKEVVDFYRGSLMSLPGSEVLFQCESRDCGSSNAWANNFFNDYLLYGADQNQSLLVSKDLRNHYWVLYINRRGAGDIMVRLDEVILKDNPGAEVNILAQLSATDIPRIRRFIASLSDLSTVVAFVTSEAGEENALVVGDRYIRDIKEGLNPLERDSIRFINLANMGDPAYGRHRVVFVRIAN